MDDKVFRRTGQSRGYSYSLEQFAEKYELNHETAEDLFYRFGPSSVELDLLMAAKSQRRQQLPFVGE